MTQAAGLDAATITQWRTRIRDDVDANYALCMALAIHQREGAAAALSWLDKPAGRAGQETARQLLLSLLLAELGRAGESEAILRQIRSGPPRREIDGLVELLALADATAGQEAVGEGLTARIPTLLEKAQADGDRLILLAIRARQHLRRGRTEAALADIATLCALPPEAVATEGGLADVLPDLGNGLARLGRLDLAVAVDVRSLALLYGPPGQAPVLLPHQRGILRRLAGFGPLYLEPATVTLLVPRLLERGDWSDEGLWDALVVLGQGLLNHDLLQPLEQLRAFMEGQGEMGRSYALRLQAEILLCDPDPGRHVDFLCQMVGTLPDDPRLWLGFARLCLAAGLTAQAGQLADKVLEIQTEQPMALAVLATLAVMRGDEAGLARLSDRLRARQGERQAFFQQAMALLAAGDAGQAWALIERWGPDPLPLVALVRGVALRALGRATEAGAEARHLTTSLSANALRRLINLARPVRDEAKQLLADTGQAEALSRNIVP